MFWEQKIRSHLIFELLEHVGDKMPNMIVIRALEEQLGSRPKADLTKKAPICKVDSSFLKLSKVKNPIRHDQLSGEGVVV